jgi:thymidylate synthase
MNKLDKDYQNLLKDILENGVKKKTRNGGTLSVFGRTIRHDMKTGFPALTTKKLYFKGVVTELLWFLKGRTDLRYLVDNDCHIWDGDCYQSYLKEYKKLYYHTAQMTKEEFINRIKTDDEFAKKWGSLGPVYGAQWRHWTKFEDESIEHNEWYKSSESIDQIANSINLLKTDPDSRRNKVSAWNVGEIDQMLLPPCHTDFQFYTRELSLDERLRLVNYDKENFTSIDEWLEWYNNLPEEFYHNRIKYTKETNLDKLNIPKRAISLMFNMRSTDVPLGLPFNIASYGLLLEIIAKEVNMIPDELIGNLGDAHIYLNQIDGVKEQLTREPFELPTLVMNNQLNFGNGIDEFLSSCLISGDLVLENYQSHPAIKMPLSN